MVLAYHAPLGCPNQAAFVAQLRARTHRASAPLPSQPSWHFHVALAQTAAGFSGKLRVADPQGAQSSRDLQGAKCDQLVAGLALMVALAIDPEAKTAPLPPIVEAPPPAPPPQPPTQRLPPPVAAPKSRSIALGLQADMLGNVAPDPLLGLGAYVRGSAGGNSVLGASVLAALPQSQEKLNGTARFWFLDARLLGCPSVVEVSRTMAFGPCASLDLGIVWASGAEVPSAQQYHRPWIAPGLGTTATWGPIAGLQFRAEWGINFPLLRDRYHFVPSEPVHHPSPIGAWGGLGIGWQLP